MARPTEALVDLDSIRANLAVVRRRIGPGPAVMVPVKANAYGHGAVAVARLCESLGVAFLAVASVEEGRELRQAGIRLPVIVLGNLLPGEMAEALESSLIVSVGDMAGVEALVRAAGRRPQPARVFVNVDTGMGRVGLHPWTGAARFIAAVAARPEVELVGVFSHFPVADEEDKHFCHEQIRRFRRVREEVERAGVAVRYWSMANSAAVHDLPEAFFNLVRPGVMTYGYAPSKECTAALPLRPAMTFRTRVVFAKRVAAGTTLGYGRTYVVPHDDSLVVTLPVGYADGYSRALSNRASVLLRGRRRRVAGRISMDQTTLDLGPDGMAEIGDEVVLFGRQGEEWIGADELADLLDTIVYEVLCAVGSRVPRRWIDSASL